MQKGCLETALVEKAWFLILFLMQKQRKGKAKRTELGFQHLEFEFSQFNYWLESWKQNQYSSEEQHAEFVWCVIVSRIQSRITGCVKLVWLDISQEQICDREMTVEVPSHLFPDHRGGPHQAFSLARLVCGRRRDWSFFSEDSPVITPLRPEWVLVRESYECHSYAPILHRSALTL